jgi:hypothetical protein
VERTLVIFVAGLVAAGVVATLAAQLLFRHIYDYDVSNGRIRVLLFRHIPIFAVSISDIQEIRKISGKELRKPRVALRLGNRVWGDCVLIQKSSGFFKINYYYSGQRTKFLGACGRKKNATSE